MSETKSMFGEPGLRLEIGPKDEHLTGLLVSASNGRFCGRTKVYISADAEELLDLAADLAGFPKKTTDVAEFSAGESDGYAFTRLRFYCSDSLGHLSAQVTLEEFDLTTRAPSTKDKVFLELRCEPAALDDFCNELRRMASHQTGSASLRGAEPAE